MHIVETKQNITPQKKSFNYDSLSYLSLESYFRDDFNEMSFDRIWLGNDEYLILIYIKKQQHPIMNKHLILRIEKKKSTNKTLKKQLICVLSGALI